MTSRSLHIWCARLEDFRDARPRLDAVLSADERVRASRFRGANDRDRFMISRAILRLLLARYLRQPAATIAFTHGRFGKPDIAGREGQPPVFFNLSHSGGVAIVAVTSACPVGVDVERLREIPDVEAIASRHLAPAEARRLMTVPLDRRSDEFLACWTRREAVLKGTGEGIGGERGACPHSDWRLHTFWPAAGYVGAVACRHDVSRLSVQSLSKESLCKSRSLELDT